MKLREWVGRIAAGRNGADRLGRFLSVLTVVLLLVSLLVPLSVVSALLEVLGLCCFFWGVFRFLSRNLPRRQAENLAYLRLTGKLREGVGGVFSRFRQRKDYRFYRCPSCRTWLRIPRNKGKVQITCRQCGERFTRKS